MKSSRILPFERLCVSLIVIFTFSVFFSANAQQKTVQLDIIDESGSVKEYHIEWPYNGPPPTGSTEVQKKVDRILTDNKIDCPPKREKVSDNIWKCGNGKKVRARDAKLGRLLSKAWDTNTI